MNLGEHLSRLGLGHAPIPSRQFFPSKHVIWPAGQAIDDAQPWAVAEHVLSGHATGLSLGQDGGHARLSATHAPIAGELALHRSYEGGHGHSVSFALQFSAEQRNPAVAFAARHPVSPQQEMGLSAGQGWAPP